jgi:hypothetical protein
VAADDKPDEAAVLAHDHAVRALDEQAGVLNELRARTSTIIAATALVATFLGGQALREETSEEWLDIAAVVPLAALIAGLYWALRVLQPTVKPDRSVPRAEQAGLRLTLDANSILAARDDDDGVRAAVARSAQDQFERNTPIIEEKLAAFASAARALMWQVGLWSLLLIAKGLSDGR